MDSDRTAGRNPAGDVRLPVVPAQRPGDAAPPSAAQPAAAPTGRPHRRPVVVGAVVTTLLTIGVGATSVAMTVQHNAREAQALRGTSRVEAVAQESDSAFAHRLGVARTQQARADHARDLADRAAAVTAAAPQVDAARAALAGAPQASPDTRAALGFAIDSAASMLAHDPPPQIEDVAAAVDALTALRTAVVDSQAAWQAAEDGRIAAEAAAARDAAAPAAQAARAPQATSSPQSARAPEPVASRSTRAPAASGAAAPQAAVPEAGAPAPAPVASALVRAWASSPAHDAWALESGVSTMHVGAAVLDDTLYGAIAFG